MPKVAPVARRKADHIQINLEKDVASSLTTGLERLRFDNAALAELDLRAIDTGLTFLGRRLSAPLLISSMTGGTQAARQINLGLAQAAQHAGVALVLHLNALQEALQPEGDSDFSGLLAKIEQVCKALTVPVVAKEVGWGISAADARRLVQAGVAAIDVAGAGGTSWSPVEMHRDAGTEQARWGG